MNTVALWILIVSSGQANYGGAFVVDRFTTEATCQAAAKQVVDKSSKASTFKYLGAICVEAEVYAK